jgi:hypothetical protein
MCDDEDDFSHVQQVITELRAGMEFTSQMKPGTAGLAAKRLQWPLAEDAHYPFDRVLQMQIAESAFAGRANDAIDLELSRSIQLALSWDRVIVMLADDLVAEFHARPLPQEHDLRWIFRLPAQSRYFGLTWQIYGKTFHGLWVTRDRHPTTGEPNVRLQLTGGTDAGAPRATLTLPQRSTWDAAILQASADTARELGWIDEPNSASRLNQFVASAAQWETLVALLYEISSPSLSGQLIIGQLDAEANDAGINAVYVGRLQEDSGRRA